MNLFENRVAVIVTKHGKADVMRPLLEEALKMKCYVSNDFDTDVYGTFSGEIARKDDALVTLRKKCRAAMDYYKCDLAIASEGSFGPHPAAFFSSADDEMVILIDSKNDLEIIGRKISLETNFAAKEISDTTTFLEFLQQVQFPSHKIILKSTAEKPIEVVKDFITNEEAILAFEKLLARYSTVFVETDMRAMNNPTRLKVIKEATQNLIEKVQSCCPKCDFPGFAVTESVSGLPCSTCNSPTKSTLYNVMTCSKCNHTEKKYFPRNIKFEDPMFCDNCNP